MYGAVFSYFAGWLNRLEKSLFGRAHEVRGDRKDLTNTPVLVIRYRRDRVGQGSCVSICLKKAKKCQFLGNMGYVNPLFHGKVFQSIGERLAVRESFNL